MKTIGLIGGMSWESTQTYYRLINQKVRDELGGLHSARLVLYSVDFAEIVASLAGCGAQGVILGCTEIGLLIQGSDTDVPLYDTTEIHAEQAVQFALGIPVQYPDNPRH